jgi:hypothetical protein
VFGPTGALIGTDEGKVTLWIADTRNPPPAASEQSALITIYAKTGQITTFPVAPVPPYATPYDFTNTGQARGL